LLEWNLAETTGSGEAYNDVEMRFALFLAACSLALAQATKYDGPRPPKPDVPYLLHATNLIETETLKAREESRKNAQVATVPGKTSPTRTPLAEPIFLFDSSKVQPEKLKLFRMDVTKDGNREAVFPDNPKKNQRPVHLAVKKLSGNLYRVEADEILENGQYCLSPEGDSTVFCFEIY
jgi:hypothetical protein